LSQSLEIFILILGSIILLLVPEGKNYKLNTNSTLSTDFAISSDKNIGSENNETSNLGKYWDNITSNVKGNLTTSNLIETGNTGLKDYPLIILFTTLGMSSLISCSDLITMFLAIELQSFALYILATMNRNSESAVAAGLKYFLLGGLSSCFILLGSTLIYSY